MNHPLDLTTESWPASQLHQAMTTLAREANLLSQSPDLLKISGYSGPAEDDLIDQWMTLTAQQIGIETAAVELSYAELERSVQKIGPALMRLSGGEEPRFLVVLKGSPKWIQLITPAQTIQQISPSQLRDVLAHELEAPIAPVIQTLLTEAGVSVERQATTKAAILREQLGSTPIGSCWLLRLSPGDSFLKQMLQAGVSRRLTLILGASLLTQLLSLLGWWVIGEGVLTGHFEWTWMTAWALLLFTAIPIQLAITWTQNLLSLDLGRLFKQRLLYGILQLEPEEIRHQGAGQFLGVVMEAESLESLALAGGVMVPFALLELLIIMGVLAMGAGGWIHVLLLAGWMVFSGVLIWYDYQRMNEWMTVYRDMTNDLVERMVGHRTRLAQELPSHWHDEEDALLERYLHYSQRKDRLKVAVSAILEYGWLIVGLSGIAYTFVVTPTASAALAISLGGILLASQSLNRLVTGISSFLGVMVTWKQVGPLFQAAARGQQRHTGQQLILPTTYQKKCTHRPIITAQDLTFRYRPKAQPVLHACHLDIYQGEHLLLEGPSGGGKSTLAALLAGLRQPESGQMSFWGIHQQTLGIETWRRRIVTAPQFHENHIFVETFAFNLLMGRRWPPLPSDLEEAELICRELGLGDLLARMPAGFQQMVGESGWQLSHGERSRLYIARALLQQADLIILDESFAALDPENLKRALQCVLRRASTLLVIAHP
jgi:ATP-binding cassette subfamily B protein